MNTSEYIDSGIIELYVAGSLTESEALEVEVMAANNPAVLSEIQATEATMYALHKAFEASPKNNVKKNILNIIAQLEDERADAYGSNFDNIKPMHFEVPTKYYMSIAASVLVLFAVGLFTYNWKSKTDKTIADLQAQLNQYESQANLTVNPYVAKVSLQPLAGQSKEMASVVFWDKRDGRVYIMPTKMDNTTQEWQYQLWAIVGDERIDAGVFSVSGEDGMLHLKPTIKGASAFAITVEPYGGKPTPSLDKIVMYAEI